MVTLCCVFQSKQPRLRKAPKSKQITDSQPQSTSQTQQKVKEEQVSCWLCCSMLISSGSKQLSDFSHQVE